MLLPSRTLCCYRVGLFVVTELDSLLLPSWALCCYRVGLFFVTDSNSFLLLSANLWFEKSFKLFQPAYHGSGTMNIMGGGGGPGGLEGKKLVIQYLFTKQTLTS